MSATNGNDSATREQPAAEKRVCAGCIGEQFLKAEIAASGKEARCSYCETDGKTITVNALADRVHEAFEAHYYITPETPDDCGFRMASGDQWYREGDETVSAIANAAEIGEAIAEDVGSELHFRHSDRRAYKEDVEYPYASSAHYSRKDPGFGDFYERWTAFEHILKGRSRFFSFEAEDILQAVFSGLNDLKTHDGLPVVIGAGPGAAISSLVRARVFAGEDKGLKAALEHPWIHLGPPPMQAASAGRMNARGISVFYGALDEATALAEVRPPVGSKVAIARFAIERSLRLLDVEALRSVTPSGSIFDPGFIRRMERASFLKILSDRISQPVMPNEEAFEYLATQAVADYLASVAKLDGIVFPAVQIGGASKNIVLFHHASRVVEVQLPTGTQLLTTLSSIDSDGESPCYSVCESVPRDPIEPAPVGSQHQVKFTVSLEAMAFEDGVPHDNRADTLSIDCASMTVRHIKAVCFDSDTFPVERYTQSTTTP